MLRRAAQLDVATGPAPDDRMPVAAVEAAAAEVGLPPAAVRQAVAELRAGVLTEPTAAPADPECVVEAAVVPLDAEAAGAAMGRWLSAQTFQRHRGRDGVEVWRIREDWVAGVQRKFDWAASVRLRGVRQVVVRTVAVEGGTLVRLEAHPTGGAEVAPAIGAGVLAVPGSAGFGMVAAVAEVSPVATAITAAGGAAAGGVAGWILGRSVRRSSRARIADELGAAIDRLGSGADDQNVIDRLRARARRSGPWLKA